MRYSKTVQAPAGKLGVSVKVTSDGPTISNIKEGSPLEGAVSTGDILVSIGGVDTRGMSTHEVSELMVSSQAEERTIVVESTKVPMISRKVEAPKGKLGLSLRVSSDGPMISNVKDTSPLDGVVQKGEYIVSIDNVDTRKMTTEEITGKLLFSDNCSLP